MNLLGKALVFVLIGCAYTQNFDQLESQVNRQLGSLNNDFNRQSNANQDFNNAFKDLNSQGFNFDRNTESRQGNFDFGNFGGSGGSSSSSSPDISEYLNYLKAGQMQLALILQFKCQEAGHTEVVQQLEQNLNQAQNCISSKINFNSKNPENEFAEAARIGDLPNFFKKYCKVWPDIHGCINPIITSIEKCFTSDEKRGIDQLIELSDDTNTFFCENNANRLIKLVESDGMQCIQSEKDDIQKCVTKIARDRQNHQTNSKKALFTYDSDDCGAIQSVRKCVTSNLATCKSKTPSEIMGDFVGLVHNKLCNSASTLSWFSFANILLLLGTYFYSKMF